MTEAKMIVHGKVIRYEAGASDRLPVDSADEIPHFETEDEERAFWETHALSERFWREAERTPDDRLPPVRQEDSSSEKKRGRKRAERGRS